MSLLSNFKNNVNGYATPNDQIYLKEIRVSCFICKKTGPPKIFKNLFRLRRHFQTIHKNELENEWWSILQQLEELIQKGVLR